MRRKKIIRLLILIAIIVSIIVGIKIFSEKMKLNKHRLASLYEELNTSQTYLFEWEENEENKTIMARKEDKTIIDDYSRDSHSTTIVKDNNTYLVLHDREEYYVYEGNTVEQNILTEGLSEVKARTYTTGTEKVKGQKYSYEEYSGSTMFMTSSTLDMNEEEIKTRFYFDKNDNLVYIRTIIGVNQELLKIRIEKEVDDSIFEIPSHYAEN